MTAGGTVRIRPNLEGGLLVESETEEIVEQFELTTSITSIHISVAVLLALDQIQTYSLSLGQLNVSTVDCLLSAVHLLEISGINASVAHIAPPSLSALDCSSKSNATACRHMPAAASGGMWSCAPRNKATGRGPPSYASWLAC